MAMYAVMNHLWVSPEGDPPAHADKSYPRRNVQNKSLDQGAAHSRFMIRINVTIGGNRSQEK